ncbi:MAG: RICIN domain-containing protein, partial [Clostridia bacterium]|nr:RICIN domain-containing protein [Clostridia bacterium]
MTEDAVTYTEIPEQRDRFTKHFQRSDGKHVAVVYSEAIHTLENGEMVNVDNRLTLNGTRYETKNTGFGASFAKSVTEENLITLSFEGYTLSWHIGVIRNLSDIQPWQRINASSEATLLPQTALELPTTNVMGRVKTVAIEDANDRRSFSKDEIGSTFLSTSGMTYSNAFSGSGIVDLVYTLSDNRLEEDILIREKGNIHSYVLTMSAKDMTARLNEDNSIIFVDEYDNEIFTIAAPWMHDATYTFSNAITVSLVQKGDLVTVIYTPDSEWLNASERVYPVLIDPSVKSRNYTSNYQDTFTYSGNTADRSAMTYTRVGKGNETYFKLLHYPMMLDAVNVESATLNIRGSANSTNLRMRVLTTAWEQSTLTYENRPLGLATVYTATTDTTSTGWRVFDLMPAMNDLAYGEADDFFNTIEGFRIYHDSTSSLYLLISSEATETDMRPYIEITYEYVHDIPVENGGVYTIKNAYSGKSLMASTSSTNVFQYSSSITNAQAFKTIGSDGCFTFESMSRTGEVLTYAYSGSETQNTVNVYTAAKTTALADSQEFLFQYVSDNSSGYQLYAIVSRADTTMALTALGTSNGSPSSAGTSTAGNVVMAPYTGSTNQLWYLESGRQPVFVGNDIVAMNSTTMAFDYGVLASYIQPYCYVTSFGETITWSSNNAAAASIATNGKVTVNGAGKVTFTATIKNSAGNELRQYSYTVIIAMGNGVYRIKNVGTGLYLGVEGETLNNNTNVTVSNKMTSGFEQYGQLWKIFYIGNGKYSIRPMQKLTMAMNRSSSNVLLYSAGITDTTAGVP